MRDSQYPKEKEVHEFERLYQDQPYTGWIWSDRSPQETRESAAFIRHRSGVTVLTRYVLREGMRRYYLLIPTEIAADTKYGKKARKLLLELWEEARWNLPY